MDGILVELSQPSWWISVVVAGILVNIFSDYIKIFFEKIYSKYSQKTSEKRKLNKEILNKEIDCLNDPNILLNAKTDLIYLATLMILYSAIYLVGLALVTSPNSNNTGLLGVSLALTLWYFPVVTVKLRKAAHLEMIIRKFYEKQGIKNNSYSIF